MAILDTVKKGYLTLKTATGYVKLLPRTLASLVSTSDGSDVQTKLDTINNNLTSHINKKIISHGSNATGGVTWDTTTFLKKNTTYHFIIVVNSNINSESYKQEISCTMNGVNMGANGNYYKLMSVFSGTCSADNKDKIVISSYKNGGSWTGWATRGIFIPVS